MGPVIGTVLAGVNVECIFVSPFVIRLGGVDISLARMLCRLCEEKRKQVVSNSSLSVAPQKGKSLPRFWIRMSALGAIRDWVDRQRYATIHARAHRRWSYK